MVEPKCTASRFLNYQEEIISTEGVMAFQNTGGRRLIYLCASGYPSVQDPEKETNWHSAPFIRQEGLNVQPLLANLRR